MAMQPTTLRIHYGMTASCQHYEASEPDEPYNGMTYKNYFGGVNAFSKEQFTLVNGFPNVYFGWGSEDDDLYHRVINANLTVQRLSYDIGRYKNLGHPRSPRGKGIRQKLFKTKQQRYLSDGLNNLIYKRISYNLKPLCTWISIGLYDHTDQVRQEETQEVLNIE